MPEVEEQLLSLNVISYQNRYFELNTSEEAVNTCKTYMLNTISNGTDYSDAKDGYQSFCEGTGTQDGGMTFKDSLSDKWFYQNDIDYFVSNNVLIEQNPTYISVIEITGYDVSNCGTDVIIPNNISGLPVARIADFQLNDQFFEGSDYGMFGPVTSIKFPNTLIYIGQNTFANADLTELTIPISVDEIGYGAFANNLFTNVDIQGASKFGFYDDNNSVSYTFVYNGLYDSDESVLNTFKYGGTCDQLNNYPILFTGNYPHTIITSDNNACEYTAGLS